MNLRFSIRNLLLGTAWFAVWGAFVVSYNTFYYMDAGPVFYAILWLYLLSAPFIGIGAIVGKMKEGVRFGLLFAVLAIVFCFFMAWLTVA